MAAGARPCSDLTTGVLCIITTVGSVGPGRYEVNNHEVIAMGHELLVLVALLSAADEPIVIGQEKHLFLDDYLIAAKEHVTRTTYPAVKSNANPVLWPKEEWEGKVAVIYGSVVRDEATGRYRMWYHGGQGVSYAESEDGVAWTKPGLGLFKIDGHDTNVVIRRGAEDGEPNALPHFYEIFGVHQDAAGQCVMGYLSIQRNYDGPRPDPFHGGQRRGLGVAKSPDGIHWTLAESWTTDAICDGDTHWMFDPRKERYVLYGRTKFTPPDVKAAWDKDPWAAKNFWGRAVARVESPDFLDWDYKDPATAPVVMATDLDDTPGDEVYSMLVFPYESVYIGLVQMFHNQADSCHLDIQLAVSHDGISFMRVGDRTTFIPCGPVGTWDRFNNSLANNPPIQVGDELRFYYGGRTYRHSPYDGPDRGEPGGGIGFASIERDRFVSLQASSEGGVIKTVPVILEGATLHLNAQSRFGEITVEILEPGTETVLAESAPVKADGLDVPVEWAEGSLDAIEGPVVLRITLKNARIYAVWCTDPAE
jgi:hypothetical protein